MSLDKKVEALQRVVLESPVHGPVLVALVQEVDAVYARQEEHNKLIRNGLRRELAQAEKERDAAVEAHADCALYEKGAKVEIASLEGQLKKALATLQEVLARCEKQSVPIGGAALTVDLHELRAFVASSIASMTTAESKAKALDYYRDIAIKMFTGVTGASMSEVAANHAAIILRAALSAEPEGKEE